MEPVRVLHVLGSLDCGGAESMVMNVYRNIDRKKIQFDFVIHTEKACYFSQEVRDLGGRIFIAPKFGIKTAFSYASWWKKIFKENNYKIVHIHMISTVKLYIESAKKSSMVILHSHSTSCRGNMIQKNVKKVLINLVKNKGDYFFACSDAAGVGAFGKEILKCKNYELIKNGIDLEKYRYDNNKRMHYRELLGLENQFVLGHVGSFTEVKNHSFLLDVFKEVKRQNQNSKLLLVGDGPCREEFENKIASLKLEKDVILLGIRDDVPEILMAMDAFVFPSLYEGLGIAFIEAQATGIKCFVSKNVPEEANVLSDLTECIPLENGAFYWAQKIVHASMSNERFSEIEKIENMGYNVKATTKKLEDFYILNAK